MDAMAINRELTFSESGKLVVVAGATNVLFAVQNRGPGPVEAFFGTTGSQTLHSGMMYAAPLDNGELALRSGSTSVTVLIQSQ
jgi:hypothetical protein